MEHEKIKPSESLQNEFEKYKNFVTNPYNLNLNPKHLQRINTYNTLTYNSLKKYLQYLVLEMKLNEKDITSFKGHILKFPEYCKWLAENVKTESFFVKSRWVSGYLSFLIREYKLDKSYIKSYEKIKKKYKLIKQRLKIVDGQYLQKRKDKLKDIDIHRITQKIKKLEKTYFITKNHLILKALITIKILFHLCWRSRNVRELKLGKTLIYEKGN